VRTHNLPWIAECGLRIDVALLQIATIALADFGSDYRAQLRFKVVGVLNEISFSFRIPQSAIRNPQSAIRNPQSAI
jgi:hypothetical protein